MHMHSSTRATFARTHVKQTSIQSIAPMLQADVKSTTTYTPRTDYSCNNSHPTHRLFMQHQVPHAQAIHAKTGTPRTDYSRNTLYPTHRLFKQQYVHHAQTIHATTDTPRIDYDRCKRDASLHTRCDIVGVVQLGNLAKQVDVAVDVHVQRQRSFR